MALSGKPPFIGNVTAILLVYLWISPRCKVPCLWIVSLANRDEIWLKIEIAQHTRSVAYQTGKCKHHALTGTGRKRQNYFRKIPEKPMAC